MFRHWLQLDHSRNSHVNNALPGQRNVQLFYSHSNPAFHYRGKEQVTFDPIHLGQLPQHVRLPEELKNIGFFPGSVRLVCLYQQSHAEDHKSTC